jgi:sulfotransferase
MEWVRNSIRGVIEGRYKEYDDKVIIDKSREWPLHSLLLRDLYPQASILLCVRDLVDVFDSIERRERDTACLTQAQKPYDLCIGNRAEAMIGPEGIIGSPLVGIQDMLRRKQSFEVVRYEDMCDAPDIVMRKVDKALGLESFSYDFDNIQNTSDDADGLYLWKYPHSGCGKVKREKKEYCFTKDIELRIKEVHGWYYKQFYGS